MLSMDLPTYLSTIPNQPAMLKDPCPHCGAQALVVSIEADTNAAAGPAVCESCNWNEDTGCAGARCSSDECWAARTNTMSRCCGEPIVYGYCNGCGEHA
jgi:hypothetical protein